VKRQSKGEPKRVKIGRQKYACDHNGKPLVGLSWDKGNGQYYFTEWKSETDVIAGKKTRKDYSFGSEYDTAIFRFKQWREQSGKLTLTLPSNIETEHVATKNLSQEEQDGLQKIYDDLGIDKTAPKSLTYGAEGIEESDTIQIQSSILADRQYALSLLRQLLQDEEIKIEAIRLLKLNDLMPKTHKHLPIAEVLNFYIQDNDCTKKEKRLIRVAVEHFMQITKKKLINDITEDDILLFRDAIASLKQSSTYTNGRYGRLKTCLNYYNDNKKGNGEKELVKRVLEYCKLLKKVSTKVNDPAQTFDVKNLKKVFKKAQDDSSEMFIMCLLMLNAGYTPVDLRGLRKDQIHEKDGLAYIDFSRTKTMEQFFRINCLWDVSAKLLREHCDSHTSEFVFITGDKGPYAESTLGKRFTTFFKGMPHSAKHFKDTVVSELAFSITNTNILKLTIGHSTAGADQFWKYVRTQPQQQKGAADLLWEKFSSAIPSI